VDPSPRQGNDGAGLDGEGTATELERERTGEADHERVAGVAVRRMTVARLEHEAPDPPSGRGPFSVSPTRDAAHPPRYPGRPRYGPATRRSRNRRDTGLAIALAVLGSAALAACGGDCVISAEADTPVRTTLQRYVDAWLANDADAVLATLANDVVLQPHHGVEPVVGASAAQAFWFPSGPPTVVTAFTLDTRAVRSCGSLAYAWGRSSVTWDYEGNTYSNEGNALSVLKRDADGEWRIAHQIWNDPPPEGE